MNLDLTYNPEQDRLLLLARQGTTVQAWWLTRRITLPWVLTWLARLTEVGLPQLPVAVLNPPRNLASEHALALEFDGPVRRPPLPLLAVPVGPVLQEVSLSVHAMGTRLQCKGSGGESLVLELTRTESHACLELLARRCRNANWLVSSDAATDWPPWLGAANPVAPVSGSDAR